MTDPSATVNTEAGHSVRPVFRLLARYFPYEKPRGKEDVTAEQLRPQFAGWETKVVLLFFVFAPVTVWLAYKGFLKVFRLPPIPPGAVAHVTLDPAFLLVPGIFVGLILVAAPVMGVVRLFMGRKFGDYLIYGNLLVGFDTVKVWAWMSLLIGSLCILIAAGGRPMHFTLYEDHLEYRRFGRFHDIILPYTQIYSVERSSQGPVTILFRDGTAWSSTDDMSLVTLPDALILELARRARLKAH